MFFFIKKSSISVERDFWGVLEIHSFRRLLQNPSSYRRFRRSPQIHQLLVSTVRLPWIQIVITKWKRPRFECSLRFLLSIRLLQRQNHQIPGSQRRSVRYGRQGDDMSSPGTFRFLISILLSLSGLWNLPQTSGRWSPHSLYKAQATRHQPDGVQCWSGEW